MELTKEALKQIIKEELEGVLEAYMGPMGPRGRGGYKPSGQQAPMVPDLAFKLLSFGWNELEEDQKERIEALAKRLYNIHLAKGSDAFKKAKENEYNTLIAAIKAAGGPEYPAIIRDENSKGEQEDG